MKMIYFILVFQFLGTIGLICQTPQPDNPETITDFDGNIYHTVTIGDQVWMVENLKVIHFRNGDPIHSSSQSAFCSNYDPQYVNYKNNPSFGDKYGRLYNWSAATDSRSICPDGWHTPSKDEWETLIGYLGGTDVAGIKLKEAGTSHWKKDVGATNESGFTALPFGYLYPAGNCMFIPHGNAATWWTSSEKGLKCWMNIDNRKVKVWCNGGANEGRMVRCIKD